MNSTRKKTHISIICEPMGRDGIGEANNQTVEFLVFDAPASTLGLKCYHQSIKSDRTMFLIIKYWQQQLRIFDKMIEKSLTGIYLQNTKVPSTLMHFICFIQASSDNYRALATHPHEPIFKISSFRYIFFAAIVKSKIMKHKGFTAKEFSCRKYIFIRHVPS